MINLFVKSYRNVVYIGQVSKKSFYDHRYFAGPLIILGYFPKNENVRKKKMSAKAMEG